jgi:hypothetical protein
MKIRFLGLIFAGIMMASAAAQATPVLTITGGTPTTIGAVSDTPFDLTGTTGLNSGSAITLFNSSTSTPFGLGVSELGKVTFTYLGKEAGFTNTFTTTAGAFSTATSSVGNSFSAEYIAGFINFVLGSGDGGSATNNGAISPLVQYAISVLSDTSVIILLDDGGQGTDFDDLAVRVDVSQVPLPPAVWLLISAILGLVSFSRIRRNGGQAA